MIQFILNGLYSGYIGKRFCNGVIGVCQDPKVSSRCVKECKTFSSRNSPCAKYHITKENAIAHICDAINFPAEKLQLALTTAPHKFCAVISETCKMFAVVGKCKTECPTLLEKCKNMLPSHGHCEDKCLDTTCVTSDFCFCPQNAWKSCTSCQPGCKLRNVDPNGHKDCAGGMCNTIVVFECILCHTFD